MLKTLKDILTPARAGRFAVPAFDCVEDLMVRTILDTAEARRSPVILMCLLHDLEGRGWNYLPGLIRAVADAYAIPVALHLDHAPSLEPIRRAVDLGFSSVMIDGSTLPLAENIKLTQAAVAIARPQGVSVEAELGYVGGMNLEATGGCESVLTEPAEVARFVAETGVDALAVSIGTAHGVYRSLPTLHIDRLKELAATTATPLVLHGGSGTPDDQIRNAVAHGICKLNLYADCRIAMGRGLQQAAQSLGRIDPLPDKMFAPIRQALAEVVGAKIDLLGSAGRA